MSWSFIIIFCFAVFAILALPGLWISIALGIAGILGMLLTSASASQVIANCVWKLCVDFTLTAVPLFIFMGEVILISGVSKRFYKGVAKYLRKIPGGMLHSNVVACGIFSAISGSSPATAAAIGGVAIPEMDKLKYKPKFTYGSIAAGGTLGILIPPSISLIIYGSLVSESVVKLFTAALIPGIVLALIYVMYLLFRAIVNKQEFEDVNFDYYEDVSHLEALKGVLPLVFMIAMVLGSIYAGFATPTEAAGLGAFVAIIIGFTVGNLTFKNMWLALGKAAKTTSMILFIILGAGIFSYVLSSSNATAEMVKWLVDLNLSKPVLLGTVYLMYIILGCFIEGTAMMYLTLPVLHPVLMAYGFDSIWFAVVLVILMEMGMITPPMGLNLFVVKGIAPKARLQEIIQGSLPYVVLMFIMIMILTFFPSLATFMID